MTSYFQLTFLDFFDKLETNIKSGNLIGIDGIDTKKDHFPMSVLYRNLNLLELYADI